MRKLMKMRMQGTTHAMTCAWRRGRRKSLTGSRTARSEQTDNVKQRPLTIKATSTLLILLAQALRRRARDQTRKSTSGERARLSTTQFCTFTVDDCLAQWTKTTAFRAGLQTCHCPARALVNRDLPAQQRRCEERLCFFFCSRLRKWTLPVSEERWEQARARSLVAAAAAQPAFAWARLQMALSQRCASRRTDSGASTNAKGLSTACE